jgi:hypothetical protein
VHVPGGRSVAASTDLSTLRRRIVAWWPYLLVVGLALFATSLQVARFKQLSPVDETRHLDYMIQLTDGHVVRQGDKIVQETMRIEACHGIAKPLRFKEPPCRSRTFRPQDFRDQGYSNVTGHPPVYYAITGFPARLMADVGISDSILDPARALGGLWLAAGLVLTLRAGELLGVRRVPLVAAAVAILAVPSFLSSHATVNPDAASVFGGGLVLLVSVLWDQRRLSTTWLAIAGGVAASLKMTNFIAIGAVALWFLARAGRSWWATRQHHPSDVDTRRYLSGVVAVVGAGLVVTLAWIAIASARATVGPLTIPSNKLFYHASFPVGVTLNSMNLFALFPPIGGFRPPATATRGPGDLEIAAQWLAISGLVAGVLRFATRDRLSLIAAGTAAVLLVGGTAYTVLGWVFNQVVFASVPRYGLSAIPMVIVLIAALVRTRPATVVLSLFAALSFSVIIFSLLV